MTDTSGLPACLRLRRPALAVTLLVAVTVNLTGIAQVENSAVLLRTMGASPDFALLAAVVVGAAYMAGPLCAMALVDRVGRRRLVYAGGAVMVALEV